MKLPIKNFNMIINFRYMSQYLWGQLEQASHKRKHQTGGSSPVTNRGHAHRKK